MKSISDKLKSLEKYKKKNENVCATYWQEEAKQICEQFGIEGKWKKMIFQKAKLNLVDLKSKVQYCNEKGIKNGRYLIAMYRKNNMQNTSNEKVLNEIREAYSNKDYYEVKKLLKTKGWLLTKEKYSEIVQALNNIKPTEIQKYVHERNI